MHEKDNWVKRDIILKSALYNLKNDYVLNIYLWNIVCCICMTLFDLLVCH